MHSTSNAEIIDLVYQSLSRGLSQDEQHRLELWLDADMNQRQWYSELMNNDSLSEALMIAFPSDIDGIVVRIHEQVRSRTGISTSLSLHTTSSAQRVGFPKTAWFRSQPSRVALRWAKYAAVIILFIGVGVAGYFVATNNDNNAIVQTEKPATPAPAANILPGSNKAILTLSNGRRVELDSAASGTITDKNLSIENNNGQLKYGSSGLVAYNTMTTPRGGQYQVILSDGTKVWLNAASSITYPTAFTGNNRTVNMGGEAYFEVAKDAKKPFIVKTYEDEITVLGTAFNINAYKDERTIKTSLVEGSVKINQLILHPGQAYVNGKISQTNIQQDIAWKNGAFDFQDASVSAVLRQIARWYNVEPVYPGGVPSDLITGTMGRDLKLTQVLNGLEGLGVKVRLEGKQLIVTK